MPDSAPVPAPNRLRILGGLWLTDAAGREVSRVLAQPKRFALLVYLAASVPRRFHRRDALLAMFWPELDGSHARTALRNALYFLHRHLGDGVVVRRGAVEVAVPVERLWCDAAALEDHLVHGRWREALAVHRGEPMPGFHLAGVPDFERWLDAHRQGVRARVAHAAGCLADAAEAAGDRSGAARWARHAVALRPEDEMAARRLMILLARLGDRAGAAECFEALRRHLVQTLDVEPSAETLAVARAVCGRQRAAARTPH